MAKAKTTTATGKTGECQICGRTQMLVLNRNGVEVVAAHGYSLTGWGNTAGACDGSRYAPAESGALNAFDWPLDCATRHIERNEADLAKYAAPGHVWAEGVVPEMAIRSRKEGIANLTRWVAHLTERRDELVARFGGEAK